MLANIHEQLQYLTYVTAGLWTSEGEDNPVSEPYRVPRPNEVLRRKDDPVDPDATEDIDEFNAAMDEHQ